MKSYKLIAIVALVAIFSCETTDSKKADDEPGSSQPTTAQDDEQSSPASINQAQRPRFSPDGEWIVFERKVDDDTYRIWRMRRDGSDLEQLAGDDSSSRFPTFDLAGERVVFASNRDGDFDLYALDLDDDEIEQVTDLEGDELEPAVSPVRYTFYAAQTDSCTSSGASGQPLDAYQKVAFTRSMDGGERTEVWFTSMKPVETSKEAFQTWSDPPVSKEHSNHAGRLSGEGESCRAPRWSGDGLSIVWTCDESGRVVRDGEAVWEQSFAAAIEAVRGDGAGESCDEENLGAWRTNDCFQSLPRSYTSFDMETVSEPIDDLAYPSVSANQVVLVAQSEDGLVWRSRLKGERGAWTSLDVGPEDARHASWDPHGDRVAFDADADRSTAVGFASTDFYLQDVRNLNRFPELVTTESERLQENGFVARPGHWKEFHAYYDKLRYMRRPAFVTADAALQVFRDEFQRILEDAETEAATRLHQLSGGLYQHYLKRYKKTKSPTDLYYARFFAAGFAPLEAYERLEKPDEDLARAAMWDDLDEQQRAEFDRLTAPAIERIPETLPDVVDDMPEPVAAGVSGWMEAMLAHEGVGQLDVPSYVKPFEIDFSQFKPRGIYAENDKGAYFLATSWFSMAPLPFDDSLHDLQEAMRNVPVGKMPAIERWRQIDSTIGAFMGSPVDPAPGHLVALVDRDADALVSFDGDEVADALREMVGPTAIRDANSAGPSTTRRKIKVTFMPKRKGLDAEFFSQLTHPTVELRPLASALDVFAVFGGETAVEHAIAQVDGEDYEASYRETLETLRGEHGDFSGDAFASTDVYHSWIAALVTLARNTQLPEESLLEFARSDAWADRRLNSALAGFAQLKHSAVLYAAQDFAAECDSNRPTYVLVEQPVLPQPRGFIEPEPQFFEQLAGLAGGVYEHMAGGREPAAPGFGFDQALNVKSFASELGALASKQIDGQELSREEYHWIRMVGGRLEALSLQRDPHSDSIRGSGDARAERGVSLATDIQTNGVRDLVRQVAIGRLLDLYVGVPDQPGRRMTQGGAFSFYEFTKSMSERLTDEEWNEMIESDSLPERPDFTSSFIQPVDAEWSEEADGDAN